MSNIDKAKKVLMNERSIEAQLKSRFLRLGQDAKMWTGSQERHLNNFKTLGQSLDEIIPMVEQVHGKAKTGEFAAALKLQRDAEKLIAQAEKLSAKVEAKIKGIKL